MTFFHQGNSIDSAYNNVMRFAKLFLDALHVQKNLAPRLRAAKLYSIGLYNKSLHAPLKSQADDYSTQYSRTQGSYLSIVARSEFYRAYSTLQELVITSQGAERRILSALKNQYDV